MSSRRRSASASSLSPLHRMTDLPSLPRRNEIKRESPAPFPLALDAPIKAERLPDNYVSLPTTPVSRTPPGPPPRSRYASDVSTGPAPFSLWDYLREELLATDFDSHQEMKWERVSNFLHVPLALEKVCPSFTSINRCSDADADNRSRYYPLLRFLSLHIYNPADKSRSGRVSYGGQLGNPKVCKNRPQ